MGELDSMGAAYALTYLNETLAKHDQLCVPEKGVGCLNHALADTCKAGIRLSAPVRRITIKDRGVSCVVMDDGPVEADAVICATSATVALKIMPDLPNPMCHALSTVEYSRGCRVVIGLDHHPLPSGLHGVLYPEDETPLLLDRTVNLPRARRQASLSSIWSSAGTAPRSFFR